MANIFTLMLAIATFSSGILWCLFKVKEKLINPFLNQKVAMRQKQYVINEISKNNNTLYMDRNLMRLQSCASIFPVLCIIFLVRSFILEPFQIPSSSMKPTLLVGDFILVKKFAYGVKNPITQTTLMKTSYPKRGDLVLFKYPLNPKLDYIKRVVGLPGDHIIYDYVNKHLIIYPYTDNSVMKLKKSLKITYNELHFDNFDKSLDLNNIQKKRTDCLQVFLDNETNIPSLDQTKNKESLGDVIHEILTVKGKQDNIKSYYQQPGYCLGEWVVPEKSYFMMGDNRDCSADSRFWGFVPEKNLVGKATMIWMSLDKEEGEWPIGVRLNRIGAVH
ncbi:signal peptidase I [secondary endosymbiont of Heteropsylla cubana]|uniref:Signal peptidase I n=1 Tax=secondary endosymbiont of Heteropsylla cubana TaxID=134287 RepID=J3TGC9_9ENTR|nr:signal peptidase I [secondary endosymbiont of Heteropsylla cubana]AFP85462.1 signal peptidase I [secondary endosymbiont of Heteropsylla cubana]